MRWPAQSHPAAVSASCSWLPHVHAKSYRASFQFTSPCCKTQAKRGNIEAHVDGNAGGTWLRCPAPAPGNDSASISDQTERSLIAHAPALVRGLPILFEL